MDVEGEDLSGASFGVREVWEVYMNVGRGCDATHEFLESCTWGGVGVAFVGECWVERKGGRGTQSHPDFVQLGSVSVAHRVTCFVLRSLLDVCRLMECAHRFVCVELGDVRIGGVYGRCGEHVHDMERWLEGIREVVGVGRWVLLGDWNAHHRAWSLDGRSGPNRRVLNRWMEERGVRLVKGEGNTFERTGGGVRVTSWIDFAVEGGGASLGSLEGEWELSDHSMIGGVVRVDTLVGVVDAREVVDWDAVALTVADEEEGWYEGFAGGSAYEKLVDFCRRQLKRIGICGRSKRWWDSDLSDQVKAVRRARRRWVSCGNRNLFCEEVSRMKRLVRETKERCWRTFCEESGLQSP